MSNRTQKIVTDALVQWAERLGQRQRHPRQNVRVLFADGDAADAVREALEARSGEPIWNIVRRSSAEDAVTLRHGRPAEAPPPGVHARTPVLYVVFWTPSERGHAGNEQSLADLRGVSLQDFLSEPELVFGLEQVMQDRCADAAVAWGDDSERARAHLTAAWDTLRTVLRSESGGRERSIPFVSHVDDYAEFLDEAVIDEAEWATIAPELRAGRMVEAWGKALPALEMFQLPELASLLKIVIDPAVRPSAKSPFKKWRRDLGDMLADNLDHASDHGNLADIIKGKGSIDEQVERLANKVPVARVEPIKARDALLRFLHDRDLDALRRVDWQFKEDPTNLRSTSHGLKGLLIARRTRVRVTPLDHAAQMTDGLLESVDGAERDDVDGFVAWCRDRVREAGTRPQRAQEIGDAIRSLGAGQVPSLSVDAKSKALLAKVASANPDPGKFAKAAQAWERLGGGAEETVVKAPTLLLGLARLLAEHLEEEANGERLRVDARAMQPSDLLRLSTVTRKGAKPVTHDVRPGTLGSAEDRESLRRWFLETVFAAPEDEEDDDDELDDEQAEAERDELEVSVELHRVGERPKTLGDIKLAWPTAVRKIAERTLRDTPRSWTLEAEQAGVGGAKDALRVFRKDAQGTHERACGDALCDAWLSLHAATYKKGEWARAYLIAPAPRESRAFVDAWLDSLNVGEAADAATLKARFAELIAENRTEEAFALMNAPRAATGTNVDTLRGSLAAWTGARRLADASGAFPERIYLTPFHPLVVRLRVLADEVLGEVVKKLWTAGWSPTVRSELFAALDGWGFPEPVHCYGGTFDGDPLTFDSWLGANGLCVFSRVDASAVRDHRRLGVLQVVRTVRRYLALHPAAGDRLRLRVQADRDGRWVSALVQRLVSDLSPDVRCDIELVTDLDPRMPTDLDRLVATHSEIAEAFEMSDDGTRPRFRIRRVEAPKDPAHLALVLGPTLPLFKPRLDTVSAPATCESETWQPRALFAVPRTDVEHGSLRMGMPRDEAALRVSLAVSFGARGASGVYVERLSFDREVIRPGVEALHEGAHWTVLIGREPLYRATQSVGDGVAELLDFGSSMERGRPVHHCVSAGSQQFGGDLARLTAMLRQLLGAGDEGNARALLRGARSLAPGLAMQCAGSATTIALQGLLGLLLTRQAIEGSEPGSVAISLDQHTELLRGTGKRGDLLVLRLSEDVVWIRAGEAKLSTGAASAASVLVATARVQLESTQTRVRHLEIDPPLDARARNLIVQTLIHQVEMAGPDSHAATILTALLRGAIVEVEKLDKSEVHAWGLSGGQDETVANPGEPRCTVYSERRTREALATLLGELVPRSRKPAAAVTI